MEDLLMESLSEITINNSGGRQGGGSPGEQGAGESGKRENEGQAAGSIWMIWMSRRM